MTHGYEGRGIGRGESSASVKVVKWIHGATLGLCESASSPIVSQSHATCIEGCLMLETLAVVGWDQLWRMGSCKLSGTKRLHKL